MSLRFFIVTFFAITINSAFCQDMTEYYTLIKKGDSLYNIKEYKLSSLMYIKGFETIEGKAVPNDRYNAACSFALAKDVDQAFYHLFRLAESQSKYKNYGHITTDTDLKSLHSDERWEKLLTIVKANKDEAEKDFDKPLVALLDSIYIEDQKYRKQIDEIEEQYGRNSNEIKSHWKLINEKDSVNLIKVKRILDEKGWLGPSIIGSQGNSTLFLVIQHADLETQIKYLPMMEEAVKKGNARASSLAMLVDRVEMRKGKRQIYGSQINIDQETGEHYVYPLIDPENVDKRRAEVGLGPLADYVKIWNFNWDVEKHKERSENIKAEKGK